jgi:hypothetical protein
VHVSGLAPGDLVGQPRQLKPAAVGVQPATRYELYVDGRRRWSCKPGGNLLLDSKRLAAGYHEARVVAIAGPLETQGRAILPFRVGERKLTVEGWPTGAAKAGGTLRLTVSLPGARRIVLLHNEREVGAIASESGTVEVPLARLGLGSVELQPVANLGEKGELRGSPHRVLIAP